MKIFEGDRLTPEGVDLSHYFVSEIRHAIGGIANVDDFCRRMASLEIPGDQIFTDYDAREVEALWALALTHVRDNLSLRIK